MLGITSKMIEKTVYIRQKEADKLALADPKELRDLITTLFGLDEFNRVKHELNKNTSTIQSSIEVLKEEVGSLPTEKRELNNKRGELDEKQRDIELKIQELNSKEHKLSNFPPEEMLIKIKKNRNNIQSIENELDIIKNTVTQKTNYVQSQEERINELQSYFGVWKTKIIDNESELKKFPSKEKLCKLQELHLNISSYGNRIRAIIKRSTINLDFDPVLQPERVRQELQLINYQIEQLRKDKEIANNTVERLNHLSTSNEILSNIKNNSIKYIEEKSNCPVCNKPIDDKELLVSEIRQEIVGTNREYKTLEIQISEAKEQYDEIDRKIEAKNQSKLLIDNLIPFVDDLIEDRGMLQFVLHEISAESIDQFLSFIGLSSIKNVISKVTDLESEVVYFNGLVREQVRRIDKENERFKLEREELSGYNDKKQAIISDLTEVQRQLDNDLSSLSFNSLDDLVNQYDCQSVDEVMTERSRLEVLIEEKRETFDFLLKERFSLTSDIKARELRIKELSEKEFTMLKKDNELKHVKYLRGEIDGFSRKLIRRLS